jgi:hypothetical protein
MQPRQLSNRKKFSTQVDDNQAMALNSGDVLDEDDGEVEVIRRDRFGRDILRG